MLNWILKKLGVTTNPVTAGSDKPGFNQIVHHDGKYAIKVIGTVTEDGRALYWTFDGSGSARPFIEIHPDGTYLIGGWTVEELRKIADGSLIVTKCDRWWRVRFP